ncbi:MAG: hypothetical protein WD250_12520 [Egibacteraceae bacterium]
MDLERREWRNEPVRLADLTLNTPLIEGRTFENCQIIGPAIIAPLGTTSIAHCTWDGDFDALVWPIAEGRDQVVGAIGALDCSFFRCRFVTVGLAVPASAVEQVRAGFQA